MTAEKNLEIVYVGDWDAHYVKLDGVVVLCGEFLHDLPNYIRTAQLLGATVTQRRINRCDDPELNRMAGYRG